MKFFLTISFGIFLAFVACTGQAQTKKMCVTVDDLPIVSYGVYDTNYFNQVTEGILDASVKYKVPLIGFVVEGTMYKNNHLDSFKLKLLESWLAAGCDLGNHTYSHIDYNNSTAYLYAKDIVKGEFLTKSLLKKYNKQLTYFRHPYLHTGYSQALSDSLDFVLDSLHYIVSPVTIDNDDYVYAKAYHNAFMEDNKKQMKYIGDQYVKYMEQKIIHFEMVSYKFYNRYVNQTLLIHASLLNAHYLDDLIMMYKNHGYSFVRQEEILNDPAYNDVITVFSRKGNSWLYRWAFSKKTDPDLVVGDPEVDEEILKLSK